MNKSRLEAFSDGVLAVIITIMVLELKVPQGSSLAAIGPMCTPLLGYVLSFVYIGIYWSNHHHLVHTLPRATGAVLWANLHLLFWLSLVPLLTAWVGEYPKAPWPTALYGVVLLAAAVAWLVLQRTMIRAGASLPEILGKNWKSRLSPLLYLAGIGLAFVATWASDVLFAVIAALWVVPDRKIERATAEKVDAAALYRK